jgi:hypothetical protein
MIKYSGNSRRDSSQENKQHLQLPTKTNDRGSIYKVIEWGLEPGVCNDETSMGLMSEGRLPAAGSAAARRLATPNT